MKKFIHALCMLVMLTGLAACSSDDDNVTAYYPLTVNIELPEGISAADLTTASVTVTNVQTGRSYSSQEAMDTYTFQLDGGTYNVQASMRINDGGTITSYNASREVSVYDATTLQLQLQEALSGGLIFKEVYYSMVKPNGKMPYMRDQFFEIYNNSDEVLYLDNCVLGLLEGTQGILPTAWMENGEIMDKYAMGYYTVAFVGTGKQYPVEPGKSVVIASQALDHIAETQKMYDSSVAGAKLSPVNLANADYEVCLIDYKPAMSIDNPDVPNMTIIHAAGTGNYFSLPFSGNAIILAKLPEGVDPIAYAKDESNFMERPDGNYAGTEYLMIPQEYVLDGINIVNSDASKRTIRLRAEVDAGSVSMTENYSGLSIRRKVESITDDGRAILKDSNNSSADFLTDQIPTPGIIPSTVD